MNPVASRETAVKDAGDIIAAGRSVAELSDVVSGAKPGREPGEHITRITPLGLMAEEVVTADLVCRKAVKTTCR